MKGKLALGAVIFTLGFVSIPLVWSDDDFRWEEYRHKDTSVAAVSNPLYKAECSSCHMAYPPGLLTSASWSKIMAGLDNHFGENAELDAETQKILTEFLIDNSADQSDNRRSREFSSAVQASDPPLRITETAFFKRKHHELPARLVSGNPEVGSFSQCNVCHKQAEQGRFNEHDIRIPGYGRWDD